MRALARSLPLVAATVLAGVVVVVLLNQEAPQPRPSDVRPPGPARVRAGIVGVHAREFAQEIPERPAGSQQELAGATYILGHLQRAGYVARLEAVPVANAVRSTDVVALPTSGRSPAVLVTVAFDTREGRAGGGAEIGLFLEVARALNVASPRHRVAFAALGAENTTRSGGHLGSRRLARLLLDQNLRPTIISIARVAGGERLRARGPEADRLFPGAGSPSLPAEDVFAAAGFSHVVVSGDARSLGRGLLDALLRSS